MKWRGWISNLLLQTERGNFGVWRCCCTRAYTFLEGEDRVADMGMVDLALCMARKTYSEMAWKENFGTSQGIQYFEHVALAWRFLFR